MTDVPKPRFTEISPMQLMRLIGTPDAPCVIDVCLPDDVAAAPYRIPTARPVHYLDTDATEPDLIGRHIVVVCQKGKKLSHGVAASFRARGLRAEVLAGGMTAWLASDLPRIPLDRLPQSHVWVTRHRPKIDRLACPWLIRRFIDPDASFLYMPPDEVMAVAEKFDAIPFDVTTAPFTHHGDRCTFDALCAHFQLLTGPLAKIAEVIRAADTNRHADAPEAAGLLALSVGLSRMFQDDQAQLAAAIPLYDALYRWARDGLSETHDWQDETGR